MDPMPAPDPRGLQHQGLKSPASDDATVSMSQTVNSRPASSASLQPRLDLDNGSDGGRVVGQDMSSVSQPASDNIQGSNDNDSMDIDKAPSAPLQPQQAALSKKPRRHSTHQKVMKKRQQLLSEAGRKRNCSEMISPPSSEEDQLQQHTFNPFNIPPPPQMLPDEVDCKRMRFAEEAGESFLDNQVELQNLVKLVNAPPQFRTHQKALWSKIPLAGASPQAQSFGSGNAAAGRQAPPMARYHSEPQRPQHPSLALGYMDTMGLQQAAFPNVGKEPFLSTQMADGVHAPMMMHSHSAPQPLGFQHIPQPFNAHQYPPVHGFHSFTDSYPEGLPVEVSNFSSYDQQQQRMTANVAASLDLSGAAPLSFAPPVQAPAMNGHTSVNGNMFSHPAPYGLPTPATGASSSRSDDASTPSGSDIDPFSSHNGAPNTIPEAHREVVCPIKENNKTAPCGKRFRGLDRFANIIEHIKQKHKKNYLPSLPANEESFVKMISMEGVICPIVVDGAPCNERFTGRNPWKSAIAHIKEEHPAYYLDNVVANAKGFTQMVNKEENMVCEILKPKARKQGQEGEPIEWEPCGKRTFGEKTFRSMQEHIRRSHRDEAYIPGLNATRPSIEQMFEKGHRTIALMRAGEIQKASPTQVGYGNGGQSQGPEQPGPSRQSREPAPASSPQADRPSPPSNALEHTPDDDTMGQDQLPMWNDAPQPPQRGDATTVSPHLLSAPPDDRQTTAGSMGEGLGPLLPPDGVQEIQEPFQEGDLALLDAYPDIAGFAFGFGIQSPAELAQTLSAFRSSAYLEQQIGVAPHDQTLRPPLFGSPHLH